MDFRIAYSTYKSANIPRFKCQRLRIESMVMIPKELPVSEMHQRNYPALVSMREAKNSLFLKVVIGIGEPIDIIASK